MLLVHLFPNKDISPRGKFLIGHNEESAITRNFSQFHLFAEIVGSLFGQWPPLGIHGNFTTLKIFNLIKEEGFLLVNEISQGIVSHNLGSI